MRSQASVCACGAFDSACRCRASTPAGPSGTTQPRSLRPRVNAPQDNRSLLTDSVDTPAVYAVPKAYWIANRWPTRCCVQAIICVPGYWISLRRRRRAWIGWGSAFRMHRQALGRVRSSPHLCTHCTHQSGPAARAAAANACAIAQKHGHRRTRTQPTSSSTHSHAQPPSRTVALLKTCACRSAPAHWIPEEHEEELGRFWPQPKPARLPPAPAAMVFAPSTADDDAPPPPL